VRYVAVLEGFGVRYVAWNFSFRGSLRVGGFVRVSVFYVSGAVVDQSRHLSRTLIVVGGLLSSLGQIQFRYGSRYKEGASWYRDTCVGACARPDMCYDATCVSPLTLWTKGAPELVTPDMLNADKAVSALKELGQPTNTAS
jgi:hypothetical protein